MSTPMHCIEAVYSISIPEESLAAFLGDEAIEIKEVNKE